MPPSRAKAVKPGARATRRPLKRTVILGVIAKGRPSLPRVRTASAGKESGTTPRTPPRSPRSRPSQVIRQPIRKREKPRVCRTAVSRYGRGRSGGRRWLPVQMLQLLHQSEPVGKPNKFNHLGGFLAKAFSGRVTVGWESERKVASVFRHWVKELCRIHLDVELGHRSKARLGGLLEEGR